ncbi:hypothetical protein P691DRAFT_703046 [Macrolepiota fuliginosa MF-IS2]|uniref:G domain-containing protein n=1 Tax=Macrolepiota fuliginosa MF-IS2 TaxID=1400762 RepID=A0A9P5XDR7_9AGAR|nr:hypothetical protein P691DRAFT_703046 [Macrolepiota fuliginosa MF-IS2]
MLPAVELIPPGLSVSLSQQSGASSYQTARSVFPFCDTPSTIYEGDVPIVAVMGPTGAGKSTFIKVATGAEKIQIGDALTSCTQDLQAVRCHNPSRGGDVIFVDTPGFDDTYKSDAQILGEIADWLRETYAAGVKLSGILYLHRITDNRMTNTLLRNLDMFQNLCGSSALSNVILVTTNWDQLQSVDEGIKNEEGLRNNYWQPLLDSGSQMLRFEYTCTSAWNIINALPMDKKPLEIQREMVDENRPLSQTSAARSMFSWFGRATENLKKLIRRLDGLIKKFASGISDAEKKRLESEKAKANAQLKDIEEQRSLIFCRNPNPNSVRSSNESTLSGDSNSSGSSWHHIVHKIYDKPETSIRQRLSRMIPRRAQTDEDIPSYRPTPPEPLPVRSEVNVVCDTPGADPSDEATIGPGPGSSTSSLTCTIQALRLARSAVTSIPIPGLGGAVGVALRIAESLSEMRDTHHDLVNVLNNASQFVFSIGNQDKPAQGPYPKAVVDAIERFCKQMEKIELIALKIKESSTVRRYMLQPDDQHTINDCNNAMNFALQQLGIHICLTIAARNEDIYSELNKIRRMVGARGPRKTTFP